MGCGQADPAACYEPDDLTEFARHPSPAINIWWAAAHMDEARLHMAKRNPAEANKALDAAETNLRAAWRDLLTNGGSLRHNRDVAQPRDLIVDTLVPEVPEVGVQTSLYVIDKSTFNADFVEQSTSPAIYRDLPRTLSRAVEFAAALVWAATTEFGPA